MIIVISNSSKSCLTCSLYLSCDNSKKAFNFVCKKYTSFEKKKKKSKQSPIIEVKKPSIVINLKKNKDGEFDFENLAQDILDYEKTSPLPRDLRIDDRDIPQAPNFYTFVTSPKFLNIQPFPFAKQIQIGTHLFGEFCPRCSDKDYIANIPVGHRPEKILERVQFLEFGKCSKCKATKAELYAAQELKVPCELAVMAGQRSGKSESFGMLSSYHLHAFLKCPSPQKMFGLLPNTDLHAMYTALTWQKAKDLLWDKIRPYLQTSPWYKSFHECLDSYGKKYGEEIFVIKDSFARYRHRSLFLYPVGPDKNKLRGTTAFQAGIDEIGLFSVEENSTKIKMNGEEVYVSVRNSFRTLRSAYYKKLAKGGYDSILPPFLGCISSPLNKKDMIVKLYEKSMHSKYIYGSHNATWEFNPNISKKDLDEEFADNPIKALRDFGAVPPNSSAPYIEDIDQIGAIVQKNLVNSFSISAVTQTNKSGKKNTTGKVIFKTMPDNNKRILAIDAGEKFNCLAGDTRVITSLGTKRIKNLKGSVTILTEGSKWVNVEFKNYGEQSVYELELFQNGMKKTIKCTGNHRWFIYNTRTKKNDEVTTVSLKKNQVLQMVKPPDNHSNLIIDKEGVRHGIVYGDGTYSKVRDFTVAYLVAHKIDFLEPFFKKYKKRNRYWYTQIRKGNKTIAITKLPRHWKHLPDSNESLEYLLGFISGYISTDGCVDKKGSVMLNSTNKKALIRVRNICNILGICTSPITSQTIISKFNGKPFTTYKVAFLRQTFPARLLLNPEHYTRFMSNPPSLTKDLSSWKIVSVKKLDIKETVYCPNVPKTHNFVLEDYILTGNSFALITGYWDATFEIPVIDGIAEIQPKHLEPINFTFLYEDVLLPIIERLNVSLVVADRWQSTKLLSDIQNECSIACENYSVKYNEFMALKEDVLNGRLQIPKPEMDAKKIEMAGEAAYPNGFIGKPISHLVYQFVTVQDNQKIVSKGEGTTDDILRALVLAYSYLIDSDYKAILSGKTGPKLQSKTALGSVATYSLGSGGNSRSNVGMVVSRSGNSSRR